MGSDTDAPIVFICHDCGTHIFVDGEMRNRLLESGSCLKCEADVTPDNFERHR